MSPTPRAISAVCSRRPFQLPEGQLWDRVTESWNVWGPSKAMRSEASPVFSLSTIQIVLCSPFMGVPSLKRAEAQCGHAEAFTEKVSAVDV